MDLIRFRYLIGKVTHYVPDVDGLNVEIVKADVYEEIWEILRRNECKDWEGILAYVIHHWDYDKSIISLEIARYLFEEKGVSLEASDSIRGKTPLQEAVSLYEPQPELVEFLIQKGAKTDSKGVFEAFLDSFKDRYLLLSRNAIKVAKLLIRAGAPLPELIGLDGHNCNVQNPVIVRELAKKLEYKARCIQLEEDLEKAHEYITELEFRPPEVGGPEYEAGLKRWKNQHNL